jgi:tetratricopeptide (TPR) repeat protein
MMLKQKLAVLFAAVLGMHAVLGPGTAAGQSAAQDDLAQVRQAAAAEAAGDLAGAERILQQTLERHPTSLTALLAFERVLLLQRRAEALLPAIDRLLQQEPGAALAHQMRLRTHAVLDRPGDIERAGRAWIATAPRTEAPYREVARVWRTRGDYRRAVEVLELGRRQIGRPDALALELGDAFIDGGDTQRAVIEWSRAVGPEGQGFILVQRRLAALPNGATAYVEPFIAALARDPTTEARRRVAINVAIEAGHAQRALELSRPLAARLRTSDRRAFLLEIARRADGAALAPVAYWAYSGLLDLGGVSGDQLLVLRTRTAELALAVGDTTRAADTYRDLEAALAPGSPARRQAMAVRIELTTRSGNVEQAAEELALFRREYPGAGEQAALAAALAGALLERGDLDGAERVLAGVPGAGASLARGRVFLRRGDLARAKQSLLESAPTLRGAQATQTIALAALIGRLGPAANEILASALMASETGDRAGAVERIVTASLELPPEERAALLDFAASHAAAGGLDDYAEQAWTELLELHGDTREAPGALLALARARMQRGEAADALPLLERLLLEHPRSTLVPQARRELERLTQPAARH